MRPLYVFILFLTLSAASPAQTTWYVPDDFPTGIQAAISNASVVNGDTIIVRLGTYKENIDFLGKSITVKSDQGPAVTVIDGKYKDPTVKFTSREGPDSILSGFTLKNGKRGGASCENSSPTITNNISRTTGPTIPTAAAESPARTLLRSSRTT